MRSILRFLPVLAVVVVSASCGSDTPTSPSLKQDRPVSSKLRKDSTAADSLAITAKVGGTLSGRAAKRATAVSTVCARQRRSLAALRAQLAQTPGSGALRKREQNISAAVGDACS